MLFMNRIFKSQAGFSHHFLLPIIVMLVVAAIGGYVLKKGRAETAITGMLAPGVSVRIDNLSPTLQIVLGTVNTSAQVKIRPVQSNNNVTSLSTVRQMCNGCLMAINGDFFNLKTSQPIGGVIIDGIVMRSPDPRRQNQVSLTSTRQFRSGALNFTGTLTPSDLVSMPVAVNVDQDANNPIVLYNNQFGSSTPAISTNFEVLMSSPYAGMALGKTLGMNILGLHTPGTPVAAGQVVLSGSGTSATLVKQLWNKYKANSINRAVQLLMTTDIPVYQSLGANAVLIKGGQIQTITENDCFANCAIPRTIMGKDNEGRIRFITIGSNRDAFNRGIKDGVSLAKAATIAQSYGLTEAINLDGGSSSTFISNGQIANFPSYWALERPVDNAWVVMP